MALVGLPEIVLFMEDAGFKDLRTFNSYDDRAPNEVTGTRLLVAGRVAV